MGVLSLDPRLIVGAYISKGLSLYLVTARSLTQVSLENAYTNATTATTPSDVTGNYVLVKPASID